MILRRDANETGFDSDARSAVELPPRQILSNPAALLEEERHIGIAALTMFHS